jgi:hypothetical protein
VGIIIVPNADSARGIYKGQTVSSISKNICIIIIIIIIAIINIHICMQAQNQRFSDN